MFRVKICGITNIADAKMAAEAGADAIGLNFYPPSKRFVGPSVARQIAAAVPPEVVTVGVFVNSPIENIRRIVDAEGVRLDLIQLHGDEPPEFLLELARMLSIPVLRAFRLGPEGGQFLVRYLHECSRLGCGPRMILVDAYCSGSYGGTGQRADWVAVQNLAREGLPPVVLAGGLTPENVAEAIGAARPAAVDVAGGVESSPGHKDPRLVRAFVEAARRALGGRDAGPWE